MAKGGNFEREICHQLSKWWTNGKRDDVFWRTSNSGGRATVRRQKGKYTYSGHADISYTDTKGKALVDMYGIELKRGYNKQEFKNGKSSPSSFQALVDCPKHTLAGTFEHWLFQAQEAARNGKAKSWMLIHKPDGRRPMVYIPYSNAHLLFSYGVEKSIETIMDRYVSVVLRFNPKIQQLRTNRIFGMRLESFLRLVQPEHIKRTLAFLRKQNDRPRKTRKD